MFEYLPFSPTPSRVVECYESISYRDGIFVGGCGYFSGHLSGGEVRRERDVWDVITVAILSVMAPTVSGVAGPGAVPADDRGVADGRAP